MGPFTNLPFECRAIYFDSQVHRAPPWNHRKLHEKFSTRKNWQVVIVPDGDFYGVSTPFFRVETSSDYGKPGKPRYMGKRSDGWLKPPNSWIRQSTQGPEPKNFERRLDEHVATWVPNLPKTDGLFVAWWRGRVQGRFNGTSCLKAPTKRNQNRH